MTTLEVFRVLTSDPTFNPVRPVEFHWYSAEELGLLGSQAIVSSYKKAGRKIYAMIQNDMTGYSKTKTPHFGIVTDFTNRDLTAFIKQLIPKYASMGFVETRCGYGCSDHASFYKAGYKSVFPFEGRFPDHSEFVHTPQDDISTVDVNHMLEFAKLSLSFAVELSH
jgi:leucyl aminopeptidase